MSLFDGYRLHKARTDASSFAAFVLRDETSGEPVTLAPHHRAIHQLLSTRDRVVFWSFAEAGKTSQLIARTAFELARNPRRRINIVSGTSQQAERTTRAVKNLIESPQFQQLFPGFSVSMREGALTVDGLGTSAKDPSVTPSGLGLGSVLGQRFDLVIGDDLLDIESTRTAAGRESAWSALLQVHLSRLAPGGRVWIAGTAWHTDDVMHRAAKLQGWASAKFPVCDDAGRSAWPERWPSERIEQRRIELGPIPFARVMKCTAIDASTLVFTAEMIDQAVALGRSPYVSAIGGRGLLAIDPAWSVGPQSDETGIVHVTIDAAREGSRIRHVVNVMGVRKNIDDLVSFAVAHSRANGKIPIYIEDNGAGKAIALAIGKQVPCVPVNTNATNKRTRVETLSAELASGRWAFSQPTGTPSPELRLLCDELSIFSFDTHCGDRASALLLASEAARKFEDKPRGGVYDASFLQRR